MSTNDDFSTPKGFEPILPAYAGVLPLHHKVNFQKISLTTYFRKNEYFTPFGLSDPNCFKSIIFAVRAGVEPVPYAVTGRHLNRLTYGLFFAVYYGSDPLILLD